MDILDCFIKTMNKKTIINYVATVCRSILWGATIGEEVDLHLTHGYWKQLIFIADDANKDDSSTAGYSMEYDFYPQV